jgi:glycyl-tRNA synthetase
VETLDDGETRTVLSLPPALAPIKLAVFPLVKKDGLPELAEKIINLLKFDFSVTYDEKDTVGKRYRRQDAIGTPYCITVDYQSIEDNTVTVRQRDTMQQSRIKIESIYNFLQEHVSLKSLLRSL